LTCYVALFQTRLQLYGKGRLTLKTFAIILFGFLLCVCLLDAAEPTGTIAGAVVDPSGAAVVGARIAVTAQATGFTRRTVTAGDGGYVFPLLPVGVCSMRVEAAGCGRG